MKSEELCKRTKLLAIVVASIKTAKRSK